MEDDALNEALKKRIAAANKPKALQVGRELWNKLWNDHRIQRKSVTIKESGLSLDGIELPFLDGNIYIEVDLSLSECEYRFFPED